MNISDEEKCKTPDKLQGTCIDALKCNEIFNMLKMESNLIIHKNKKNLLKQYHCGFDGLRPKVTMIIYVRNI